MVKKKKKKYNLHGVSETWSLFIFIIVELRILSRKADGRFGLDYRPAGGISEEKSLYLFRYLTLHWSLVIDYLLNKLLYIFNLLLSLTWTLELRDKTTH